MFHASPPSTKANTMTRKRVGMTPLELSEFSHQFPEWKQYEESLKNPKKKNGYKIDLDLFFENKEEASGLFKDSPELLELTKEVYHQYKGC